MTRFIISRIFVIAVVFFTIYTYVNLVKYPEQYMSTWRYQMENELKNGNQEMLEYYNTVYIDNGKRLYGDKYILEGK